MSKSHCNFFPRFHIVYLQWNGKTTYIGIALTELKLLLNVLDDLFSDVILSYYYFCLFIYFFLLFCFVFRGGEGGSK